MDVLETGKTIEIILRTLNYLDKRLVNHGVRVAYLVYYMLSCQKKYSKEQIQNMTMVALLHDIGAFKTEEIDRIVEFESGAGKEHSIYGYLFIKLFSPLKELADTILYHHIDYSNHPMIESDSLDLADVLHLADRIDIMLMNNKNADVKRLSNYADDYFSKQNIELFYQLNQTYGLVDRIKSNQYLNEFMDLVRNFTFTQKELVEYLYMLTSAIDFRSSSTVAHTITTVFLTIEIGKKLNCRESNMMKLALGSLLHDVGKIATPLHILEKPDRLTKEEMHIMQQHVVVTAEILDGLIDTDIFRIATRHHEKLDGSGYPYGLSGDELSELERVVAIADVLSALIGKRSYKDSFSDSHTITILRNMAHQGKLCSKIVDLVVENYHDIISHAHENAQQLLTSHEDIKRQYHMLYQGLLQYR